MEPKGDIALIGLAVMGQNLILNMNDPGYTVVAFNRTVSKVDDFLNAAAAVYVGGKAASLEEGMQAAAESVDSGRAQQVLEGLVELTNR